MSSNRINNCLFYLSQSQLICPAGIELVLETLKNLVHSRLYIAVDLQHHMNKHAKLLPFQTSACIYRASEFICAQLDVRVLTDSCNSALTHSQSFKPIEIERLYSDAKFDDQNSKPNFLINLLKRFEFTDNDSRCHHLPINDRHIRSNSAAKFADVFLSLDERTLVDAEVDKHDGVVLGGTFDRLHNGHKILLSCSAMIARSQFTCGVTDGPMNNSKVLPELIEPIDTRIQSVLDFVQSIKPQLRCKVVPITDPFGPSIVDTNLDCIVASKETVKGAHKVNQKRVDNELNELSVYIIDVIDDTQSELGDGKISSSTRRRLLLGSLIRPPHKHRRDVNHYLIGLTGGIASGKTHISQYLTDLGAFVIDCDKLGHEVYEPGTDTYHRLIEEFGTEIVHGQIGDVIDRNVLGPIVFKNPELRSKLNAIVWPEIRKLAQQRIATSEAEIVVVDAAVLMEAGWDTLVDEIWLPIIPRNVAIQRIQERNQLSAEAAALRVDAQMTNAERVTHANVVLCSLWDYEVTKKQVQSAWKQLMTRLHADAGK